ncbi:MAG TPA: tetratricopeptide repeat protein, partial [Acidobacteriota bacterium]|nr:tetratricopeptide repeat protein [Acidobacteriota bacterium]
MVKTHRMALMAVTALFITAVSAATVPSPFELDLVPEKGIPDLPPYLIEIIIAAEKGDARVQYHLGAIYVHGEVVPQDFVEAEKWFRKSADRGEADAQFALGGMYILGLSVPQNHAEALRWYRRAAEQGHAQAQYNLGAMYARGEVVPQDSAEAAKWFRKSA